MNPSLVNPFISVVIRSYNRLNHVLELVDKCLDQKYNNYEVVIIDQSDEEQWEKHKSVFFSLDEKIRIIRTKPRGSAAARNLGVYLSKGDVILLIDDDDLPIGDNWISSHARHYDDPNCIGVSGRCVQKINEKVPYKNKQLAYDRCLTYSFFLRGLDQTRIDKIKKPVQWLHGLNASIRKSYVLKLGGWYPYVQNSDEHSFGFKFQKEKDSGEYLMFDPEPIVLRRYNIPGGLGKRYLSLAKVLNNQLDYYHRVVGTHFPLRFYGLYLIFMLYIFQQSINGFRRRSYYSDNIWIRWFGKNIGLRLYFFQEFVKYPILVIQALLKRKPTWNGNLAIPDDQYLEVRL